MPIADHHSPRVSATSNRTGLARDQVCGRLPIRFSHEFICRVIDRTRISIST